MDKYTTKVDLKFPSGAFLNFLTVDFFKILPKTLRGIRSGH